MLGSSQSGNILRMGLLAGAISLFASQSIFAGAMSSANESPSSRVVVSLGGGAAFTNDLGQSQTFPIVNPLTDSFYIYTPNRSNQTSGLFDSFIGLERLFNPQWAVQIGLGYVRSGNLSVQGALLQGADIPSANQFAYEYSVITNQLMAEGKLLYQFRESFHPYLFLGVGGASNKAQDYTTTVPPFLTFTREYADNTHNSFTYAAGVGVDMDVANHLRLGLGYRYADLGKAQLGNATIDTSFVSGTLSQTRIQINELIAQLTFLF